MIFLDVCLESTLLKKKSMIDSIKKDTLTQERES